MPKINVYLSDELAEAVKEAGIPVSAVCQRALEQAVRRITAVRETAMADLDATDPGAHLAHFTARSRTVLKLASEQARGAEGGSVGTEHLLGALLAEGENLALHVLRALEIEPERAKEALAAELSARRTTGKAEPQEDTTGSRQPGGAGGSSTGSPAESPSENPAESPAESPAATRTPLRFTGPAAEAMQLTATEATTMGHNYVGCEHLLLGLVTEPEGTAGRTLRALGAEPRLTRRAVAAALAGYVHLRAQTQSPLTDPTAALIAAVQQQLQPLTQRIAQLETHMGLGPRPYSD